MTSRILKEENLEHQAVGREPKVMALRRQEALIGGQQNHGMGDNACLRKQEKMKVEKRGIEKTGKEKSSRESCLSGRGG